MRRVASRGPFWRTSHPSDGLTSCLRTNLAAEKALPSACRRISPPTGLDPEWCERRGLALDQVEPIVVAAYVEELTRARSPATVKQHLAPLRMLFDWLVIGQVLPSNPASPVRGSHHVVKAGKTPVLSANETRALLDVSTLVGLRDRAFLGVLVYSLAHVSAAVSIRLSNLENKPGAVNLTLVGEGFAGRLSVHNFS